MAIPKSYRVATQFCRECKFVFTVKYYHDPHVGFFCTYKAKRPKPCGGVGEAFFERIPKNVKNITRYVDLRREKWCDWAAQQEVDEYGTCNNFKER